MAEEKATMSAELAEQEFNDWAENMGLEVEADESRSEMNETLFSSGKKFFIRALTKGSAVINDSGNLIYTVSRFSPEGYKDTEVEINIPSPRAFAAVGKKGSDGTQKALSIASSMTGKDTGWFLNLGLPDFKFFMGIVGLFLMD